MLGLVLIVGMITAVVGLVVKYFLDLSDTEQEITWLEYGLALGVILTVMLPLTVKVGWDMAKEANLSFNEYWNGWELQAVAQPITCTRDGPCAWEYSCDPYYVLVTYSCNCDKNGCDVCTRLERRTHDCPYVKVETTYVVKTTLEDFVIAKHRLPDDPNSHLWRDRNIPPGVMDAAGVGAPQFWLEAQARCDSGNPGPVTVRRQYDNYLLAADQTILNQYSADIEMYLKAGLLPPVANTVKDFYLAEKVSFVGYKPSDPAAWQQAIGYLNAGLGNELQGDLHLVIVQNDAISLNPDSYLFAIKAYWQDKNVWGDNTLSKNGIIVVLGTNDGESVAWARSITGMPVGNEYLIEYLNHPSTWSGVSLTPEAVLGEVHGQYHLSVENELEVRALHGSGVLEDALWGISNPLTGFQRVSMTSEESGDVGPGFTYWASQIQPTGGQKWTIGVVAFFVSLLAWVAVALLGERYRRHW